MTTDVLVCHSDGLVADAIRSFLEAQDFRVSLARTVDDVLDGAHATDTCLFDMGMTQARTGVRRIVSMPKAPRLFALVEDEPQIASAVESGANACVAVADGLDRLVHLLRSDIVVTSQASAALAQHSLTRLRAEPTPHRLTAREAEVLAGLVRGESTKALAARMKVRPATARTHVQHVLAKLGVHSRLQAVAFVIEHPIDSLVERSEESDDGAAAS